MDWHTPFEFDFMLTAFAISALVGTVCAVFSCFLILKGWSLMGDAISHAVLPGIVLAYLAGVPLAIGAFVSGLFCAVGTGYIKNNSRIKEDTVMGVVFTGLFALGLVLFSKIETDQHLTHILFGNLLGIPPGEVTMTVVIGTLALVTMLLFRRDLVLFCFDPIHARSIGLNTTFLYYLLLSLLALTIVASLQAVGIILVIAMLITPGCIGFLLTRRFSRMMAIAVATAVFSSVGGTYASFFLDASTGACIILLQAALFVIVLAVNPRYGLRLRG
ncbi:MAG TPA: metal ABC transporter permease [Chthoniobacteraceae bacterium]|nr:metal ABC transporter permease [Chthoniobacteraceae bacterium]